MTPEAAINIDLDQASGIGIVRLRGRLVAETRYEFKTSLREWEETATPARVAIILRDLEYMDSAGLAALIGSWKKFQEGGGELVLAEVNPQLKTLFQVTMIEKFFKIFPSYAEAEAHLTRGTG